MKIEREEFERERNYLYKTVSLIRKKISKLGQELFDDDSKVLEFKKLIWDTHTEMDPNEMRSMMAESDLQVSIMQSKGNYLQRLFRFKINHILVQLDLKKKAVKKKIISI